MTVTCIINQLDLRAGTRGEGACIFSGRDKLAKPEIKSASGLVIEPIKETFDCSWTIKLIKVTPHVKNINDS
jgi:hypothetical protein